MIAIEHLNAALALWDYCEKSAAYIFGDRLGDPIADAILDELRKTPRGLTRTEIHAVLGRNLPGERLDRVRQTLVTARLIRVEREPTEGRHIERWTAVGAEPDGSP